MARPNLPVKTQAAIEDAREKVLQRRLTYEFLFENPRWAGLSEALAKIADAPPVGTFRAEPKPAKAKLALQGYSGDLFDAEAQYYSQHARNGAELEAWLKDLATCIESEVLKEVGSVALNFHCPGESQRKEAIADGLKLRI